jgi:hypothetical protein
VNPPEHPASLNTLFTIAAKGYGHLYFRRNVSSFNFTLAAQSGTLDWQRRLIRNVCYSSRSGSFTRGCAKGDPIAARHQLPGVAPVGNGDTCTLAGLTALRRPHNVSTNSANLQSVCPTLEFPCRLADCDLVCLTKSCWGHETGRHWISARLRSGCLVNEDRARQSWSTGKPPRISHRRRVLRLVGVSADGRGKAA